MSCKRVTGEEAKAAQPVAWRRTGVAMQLASRPQAGRVPNLTETFDARMAEMNASVGTREREAREKGLQDGEAAAAAKVSVQVDQMAARSADAIGVLMKMERQLRVRMEEDLAKLSTMIARRILHREINVDPDALLGIVRAALAKVDARELHRVRIYPRDAPLVEKHLAALHLPQRVEVIADPALERGAMLFETQRGVLDASIETQLEEIDRGFADLMRGRS